MPFCNNCKTEYREGFSVCPDCGAALTDECDFAVEGNPLANDVPAFLCTLADGIETDITVSLLESNGVPVLKQYRGIGEYLNIYMGSSYCGVDIYVPSKLLATAKEILSAEPVVEQDDVLSEEVIDEEVVAAEEKDSGNKHNIILSAIIYIILLLLLAALLPLIKT